MAPDGYGSRGVALSGSHVGSLQGAVCSVEMELVRDSFGLGLLMGVELI